MIKKFVKVGVEGNDVDEIVNSGRSCGVTGIDGHQVLDKVCHSKHLENSERFRGIVSLQSNANGVSARIEWEMDIYTNARWNFTWMLVTWLDVLQNRFIEYVGGDNFANKSMIVFLKSLQGRIFVV
jgi:hypothetical protein